MGIDVVVSDAVGAFAALVADVGARLQRGQGGVLRTQNDFVNFALARGEFSVGGKRAGNVRGVAGILRADIQHDDIAILNFSGEFIVVQDGGIRSGANDGRVTLGL
jgi:hypothetical protein